MVVGYILVLVLCVIYLQHNENVYLRKQIEATMIKIEKIEADVQCNQLVIDFNRAISYTYNIRIPCFKQKLDESGFSIIEENSNSILIQKP
jgi:N-dimethylarginine dimethylaminohydrolase